MSSQAILLAGLLSHCASLSAGLLHHSLLLWGISSVGWAVVPGHHASCWYQWGGVWVIRVALVLRDLSG